MLGKKEKISILQAMIIFLVATSSATLNVVPGGTVRVAKQAAWLSPFVALAFIIPVIFVLNGIYKKYKEASFTEVIDDICGAVVGKIVTGLFVFFLTILISEVVRYLAENLVSSIFPSTDIIVFIAVTLFSVSFIVRRGGIVVLARMSEIMFVILVGVLFLISILAGKDIEIGRLTPISHLDFFPVLNASLGIVSLWANLLFIFLFGNYINNKERILKVCTWTAVLAAFLTVILLVVTIGVLGASTIELSRLPFALTVRQISVFETIERIEATVVSMWMISDFMLSSIILFTVLNLLKLLFKLSDTKPLCSIYSVIVFFISLMLTRNFFELQVFLQVFIRSFSIFLGYILPVLVFIVGKLRKKL